MAKALALLLDFCKAYDSVDRNFLYEVLEWLGFPGVADDTASYVRSILEVVIVLAITRTFAMASGLKLNEKKTLVIALNPDLFLDPPVLPEPLRLQPMHQLSRYLGHQVGSIPERLMRLLLLIYPHLLWSGSHAGSVRYSTDQEDPMLIHRFLTQQRHLHHEEAEAARGPTTTVIDCHRNLTTAIESALGLRATKLSVHPHPRLARIACLWMGNRRWKVNRQGYKKALTEAKMRRGKALALTNQAKWGQHSVAAQRGLGRLVDQDLLLQWLEWYFPQVTQSTGQWIVWDSMRAHIGKKVNQRCEKKTIKMAVIPDGLTPYFQAGDVGIFKSFKDRMSVLIDQWKRSDQVSYTPGSKPRPPSVEMVVSWVTTVWRQVPDSVVQKSVGKCGFSGDSKECFISKHDVFGAKFQATWDVQSDESDDCVESDGWNELLDALDEIWIEE